MKLKKRKLKVAALFGVCWFALLVVLVDGVVGFPKLENWFGSYALAETVLWLLVLLPTAAVYLFAREKTEEFDQGTEKNR